MGEATQPPDKLEVARVMLLRGSVFVHLDPRVEGVSVPSWFCDKPQLVLQVGLDMAVPILDLKVDHEGVRGTLSFNRSPWFCTVPWEAIFALQDDNGKGMVWPESLPLEIISEVEREAGAAPPPEPSAELIDGLLAEDEVLERRVSLSVVRSPLRVVEGGADQGGAEPHAYGEDSDEDAPATPIRVPHLRLVK